MNFNNDENFFGNVARQQQMMMNNGLPPMSPMSPYTNNPYMNLYNPCCADTPEMKLIKEIKETVDKIYKKVEGCQADLAAISGKGAAPTTYSGFDL